MSYTSYKILAAQRLNIHPAELLDFHETNGICYATTPDGVQHIFTCAHLDHPPAKKVAEKALKGPNLADSQLPATPTAAIPIAKPKPKPKPKP